MKFSCCILGLLFMGPLYAGPVLDSRGRPAAPEALRSFAGQATEATGSAALPATLEAEAPAVQRLNQHVPPLAGARSDRWPILCWMQTPGSVALADALIERGISPLFNGVSTPKQAALYLPLLRHFQSRGVPLIILPQGVVQRAYHDAPHGLGCDHLPPARPAKAGEDEMEPNRDFTCPAWMYENPALAHHRANVEALCLHLRDAGIQPAALWLDFESGAYLRNGAEKTDRVTAALAEAARCPRCVARFGKDALATPERYSQVVDQARAWAIRTGFVEPARGVFPQCSIGNFFAWPANRRDRPPGEYPAYGYEGSGMNVFQPRTYFTPGWGGAGADPQKTDWNIFFYAVGNLSRAAQVRRPGEILVPWLGYLWTHPGALAKASRRQPVAAPAAYRELAIHLLLRGAETIAVFTPGKISDPLPEAYTYLPRRELGPVLLDTVDIQAGYRAVLPHHDLLRAGRPLNLELAGDYNRLDETAAVWSGVGTGREALVRTVAFGPELEREIALFERPVRLPFRRIGAFWRVFPDGRVESLAGPEH